MLGFTQDVSSKNCLELRRSNFLFTNPTVFFKIACPTSSSLVLQSYFTCNYQLSWKIFANELEQLEIKLIHYVSPIHWLLVPVSAFEEEICLSYQNGTFARYIFRSLQLYQRLSNMKNNVFEEIFLTNRVIGSWETTEIDHSFCPLKTSSL